VAGSAKSIYNSSGAFVDDIFRLRRTNYTKMSIGRPNSSIVKISGAAAKHRSLVTA
jgi:hypothetical protein